MSLQHRVAAVMCLCALGGTPGAGQEVQGYGVQGGWNLANIRNNEWFNGTSPILGLTLGFYTDLDFDLPVPIRQEFSIIQRGYQWRNKSRYYYHEGDVLLYDTYTWRATIQATYLEIAALAVLPFRSNLSIHLGPYLDHPIHLASWTRIAFGDRIPDDDRETTRQNLEEGEVHNALELNGMDVGIVVGGGFDAGHWTGCVRLSWGLRRAYTPERKSRNYGFQFMVGYGF